VRFSVPFCLLLLPCLLDRLLAGQSLRTRRAYRRARPFAPFGFRRWRQHAAPGTDARRRPTHRCAVRLLIAKSAPMGAGRSRFQRVPSFTKQLCHVQLVDIERRPASSALRSALAMRCAKLFDVLGRAFGREAQRLQCCLRFCRGSSPSPSALFAAHAHMPGQRVASIRARLWL